VWHRTVCSGSGTGLSVGMVDAMMIPFAAAICQGTWESYVEQLLLYCKSPGWIPSATAALDCKTWQVCLISRAKDLFPALPPGKLGKLRNPSSGFTLRSCVSLLALLTRVFIKKHLFSNSSGGRSLRSGLWQALVVWGAMEDVFQGFVHFLAFPWPVKYHSTLHMLFFLCAYSSCVLVLTLPSFIHWFIHVWHGLAM
jgi:hypothetical protein